VRAALLLISTFFHRPFLEAPAASLAPITGKAVMAATVHLISQAVAAEAVVHPEVASGALEDRVRPAPPEADPDKMAAAPPKLLAAVAVATVGSTG
jgi:hypothetical protein